MAGPPRADFNIAMFYEALDAQRRERELTWPQVSEQMSAQSAALVARLGPNHHPLSPSTMTGMRERGAVGGNHALGMLQWLGVPPEAFVPGATRSVPLPEVDSDHRLRWDCVALHRALDTRRRELDMTWQQVAQDVGCSVSQLTGLTRLRYGPAMATVMRTLTWLGRPSAEFVYASKR